MNRYRGRIEMEAKSEGIEGDGKGILVILII
jgi:hypothetical protein